MAKVLKLDNKTATNYIDYLREVKLIGRIHQYSASLNERLYSPKKYYFSDLGMRNSFVGFSDIGSLVENALYIRLISEYGEESISYLSDSAAREVDFVVETGKGEVMFVESKYHNLEEKVMGSISKNFFTDIFGRKIIKRIVVTDGISGIKKIGENTIELTDATEFLKS